MDLVGVNWMLGVGDGWSPAKNELQSLDIDFTLSTLSQQLIGSEYTTDQKFETTQAP